MTTVKQYRIKCEDKKDYKKLEKMLDDDNIPYRHKGDKDNKPIYIREIDHPKAIDLMVLFPDPSMFNVKEKEIEYDDSVEYNLDKRKAEEERGNMEQESPSMYTDLGYDADSFFSERDAARERVENAATEQEISVIAYPDEMSETDRRILEKLDRHENLTTKELKYLAYECEIDTIEGEDGRWTKSVTTIAELGGRTFSIDWERGLTEMQENEFFDQPIEVFKHEHEETVTVTDWLPISMRAEMENAHETKPDEVKKITDALRREINAMEEKEKTEELDTDPEEEYDEDLVY